jgi:nucleotide-binding universal stress UspA family protein
VKKCAKEVKMFSHILVPLDGSSLAECVLPHLAGISAAEKAHFTLLHVLEAQPAALHAIDMLDWSLQKREARIYLDSVAARLSREAASIETLILEGPAADCVIDYARTHQVDLIALSSHGRSGLSGWNLSSVVQKIILRSYRSILLIPAYRGGGSEELLVRYQRIFVGLDSSTRAEYIIPFAVSLARFHKATLVLGMIIRKPEMIQRLPLSEDDIALTEHISERNLRVGQHYLDQLRSQISIEGAEPEARLLIHENVASALHDLVAQENADLVMLVAHGHSGDDRWPYGGVATSFIAYGRTPLIIVQDLSAADIRRTEAELAAREKKGH